jgi:hypothetical protein
MEMIFTRSKNPITPNPGVYYDVPWREYAAWDAFSKSMVSATMKSAAHLHHYIHGPVRKSKAMGFGSLVDVLLLEPELFEDQFAIQPETYTTTVTKGRAPNKVTEMVQKPWNINSHTCKEIAEGLRLSGKRIVEKSQVERAKACVASIMANDELCKARFDMLPTVEDRDAIWDLKTSKDASSRNFGRDAATFGYHIQSGSYSEGFKILTGEELGFNFLVVETSGETEKPAVAIYGMGHDDDGMVAGRLAFKRAVKLAASYRDHWEDFSGYSEYIEPLELPRWAIDKEIDAGGLGVTDLDDIFGRVI